MSEFEGAGKSVGIELWRIEKMVRRSHITRPHILVPRKFFMMISPDIILRIARIAFILRP
jgi:hypothetical protein